MADLPSSLALLSIADGSLMVASDERNNYAAVQTAVNALITALSGGSSGQVLQSGGADIVLWSDPATATTYRKTTAKAVNTTTAATDLLNNGEITVGAGVLGTTGVLRLTAFGDWLQNSGGAAAAPRFQLVLGGTTIFDTGALAVTFANNASRFGWEINAKIVNAGSASAQASTFNVILTTGNGPSGAITTTFTVGEGNIEIASGFQTVRGQAANPSTTVNTAASAALALNVINGSASATYETKLLGAIVEVL
jgi:hypothetical protein